MKKLVLAIACTIPVMLIGCNKNSSNSNDDNHNVDKTKFKITSTAPQSGIEDTLYSYQIITNKKATDSVTFSGKNLPSGMKITQDGLITWTPLEGVLTSGEIEVSIKLNTNEAIASQNITINIVPINDAPHVEDINNHVVIPNEKLEIQLIVSDPDDENNGTDIKYQIVEGPEGAVISSTGLFSFKSIATTSKDNKVTIIVSDGGEDNIKPVSKSFIISEHIYPIDGYVNSYNSNEPIKQAKLTLSQNGIKLKSTNTDNLGYFQFPIKDTSLNTNLPFIISADSESYSESSISLTSNEINNDIFIYLPKNHINETINNQQDNILSIENETIISIPKNSFVDSNGVVVTGNIATELFIIDPNIDINLMPGEMTTIDENGNTKSIESFGAFSATFTGVNGELLNLAPNKSVDIRIPVSGNNPPPIIPLYYFDSISGLWIKDGEATLSSDNKFYEGSVTHFTTWNADIIYDSVTINGCVLNDTGTPLTNTRITTDGLDYNGKSSAYTNNDGKFSIQAKPDSTLLLSANRNYQSRTKKITTGTTDINLEECLQADEATSKVTLTWGKNPRDIDTHFYGPTEDGQDNFHIYYRNKEAVINDNIIYLDVDDTNGYGPEILTIPNFTLPGRYSYVLHRYAGNGSINNPNTRIELIINNERMLFTPTVNDPALEWWHVFDINIEDNNNNDIIGDAPDIEVTKINAWSDNRFEYNPSYSRRLINESIYKTIPKRMISNKYYSK